MPSRSREIRLFSLEDNADLYRPIEDEQLDDYVALVSCGFVVGGPESSTPPSERQRWFEVLCDRAGVDELLVRAEVVWDGYGGMAGTLPMEDFRCGLVRLLLPTGADAIDPAMPPILVLRSWRTARHHRRLQRQLEHAWGATLRDARERTQSTVSCRHRARR